jgi:hypothetical protein
MTQGLTVIFITIFACYIPLVKLTLLPDNIKITFFEYSFYWLFTLLFSVLQLLLHLLSGENQV